VKIKRGQHCSSKKAFKELRRRKTKAYWPIRVERQDILERYEILSAAYHGGDLNGVCSHHLLANA
jgi:hypothetical protein